ncbi:unnamed protein product, partial [Mesorhabditis spiculigera]
MLPLLQVHVSSPLVPSVPLEPAVIRRRTEPKFLFFVILFLTCAFPCATACTDTLFLHQENIRCTSAASTGRTTCTLHKMILAQLSHANMDNCFLLRDLNHTIIGEVRIRLLSVRQTCQKAVVAYTRDSIPTIVFNKRCPRMGSCKNNYCAQVTSDTIIPELPDAANHALGSSHCAESCGGIGCLCGFFSPGCLFYRITESPVSRHPIEYFKCRSWKSNIDLEVQVHIANRTSRESSRFKPYRTAQFQGYSLVVNSADLATFDSHFQRFLLDKSRNISALAPSDFQPLIKCRSPRFLNCTFFDSCTCHPIDDNVDCRCHYSRLQAIFQDLSQVLPVTTPDYSLVLSQGFLPEIYHRSFQIGYMLDLQGLSFEPVTFSELFQSADIRVLSVSGCFSCSSGALVTFSCQLAHPDLIPIYLECHDLEPSNSQFFAISCRNHAVLTNISLHFSVPQVQQTCRSRQIPSLQFPLTGVLHFDAARQSLNSEVYRVAVFSRWHFDIPYASLITFCTNFYHVMLFVQSHRLALLALVLLVVAILYSLYQDSLQHSPPDPIMSSILKWSTSQRRPDVEQMNDLASFPPVVDIGLPAPPRPAKKSARAPPARRALSLPRRRPATVADERPAVPPPLQPQAHQPLDALLPPPAPASQPLEVAVVAPLAEENRGPSTSPPAAPGTGLAALEEGVLLSDEQFFAVMLEDDIPGDACAVDSHMPEPAALPPPALASLDVDMEMSGCEAPPVKRRVLTGEDAEAYDKYRAEMAAKALREEERIRAEREVRENKLRSIMNGLDRLHEGTPVHLGFGTMPGELRAQAQENCVLCSQAHSLLNCYIFATAEERSAALARYSICDNCFSHTTNGRARCHASRRFCTVCVRHYGDLVPEAEHNSALCPRFFTLARALVEKAKWFPVQSRRTPRAAPSLFAAPAAPIPFPPGLPRP